jgi:hypothetical protein
VYKYFILIWLAGGIEGAAHAPVVRARISKQISKGIKISAWNRTIDSWAAFQSLLIILIPEIDNSVTTNSCECSDIMKANSIDTESIRVLSMALERK